MSANVNPVLPFQRAASHYGERVAVSVGDSQITYGELCDRAARLAGLLSRDGETGRVGILATRSIDTYVAILAALWAGKTYVPLNLKWPPARLASLMRDLKLDALVADANGAALLGPEVMAEAPALVVVSDGAPMPAGGSDVRTLAELGSLAALPEPAAFAAERPAYVIFTSGTTGTPKGVVISAGQLAAYLAETRGWTDLTPQDRVAETCDATFDLSVHNLFLTLESGASLHLMRQLEMMAPARFVRERAITCWMSVPTVIGLMQRTGQLKPGIFPSLRLSIFCGEPLPLAGAKAWADAAPASVVENIYGPTECTVVCLRQRLTEPAIVTPGRNVVAIGAPYSTMDVAILDDALRPVADGTAGEIALCGPQVGIGYLNAPSQTADRFREIEGRRWYLTGDLGLRDANGVFHHLGRVDNQVKLKGNRIELEEVEAHLRAAAGTQLAAVVAWPVVDGSAQGLVAFVAGGAVDSGAVTEEMARNLPRYMVPGKIRTVADMPQNINGKIDRRALVALLEAPAPRPVPEPA